MKVVLAPDSFKESMTAREAAAAMERGVRAVLPDAECVVLPMADGGEGTVDALLAALGGELVTVRATGPMGRPVDAAYGWVADERLAIIEVAAAVGIDLVPVADRDPWRASSTGVGEMLVDALDRGARRLVVGLGGTVTNDGGAGMLRSLGLRFLDAAGADLVDVGVPLGPDALGRLAHVDASGLDPRLAAVEVDLASDVTNPLLGLEGASAVFGPQKGATPEVVERLEAALTVLGGHLVALGGRDVTVVPGAGAAGGLGAAFLAVCDAHVRSGIEVVMDAARLDDALVGADVVFTGEGSVDDQTAHGKAPLGVARAAQRAGVPVIVFAGRVEAGAEVLYAHGVHAVVPITRGACDLATALREGATNLETAVATTCRLLVLGRALR